MATTATERLKQAEHGALLSVVTYILLSLTKLLAGNFFKSEALFADGLNNFTDVISSILVFVGLRISQKPSDENHPYGHWKFETIASLATSFIMFLIGIEVLRNTFEALLNPTTEAPSILSSIVGFISGIIMLAVYTYNKRLAQRIQSLGLKATAKDNLSDALTSFLTAIAVLFASLGLHFLDNVMAFIVGLLIIRTAYDVFKESTFQLTDGFEQEEIDLYIPVISAHPEVKEVGEIKARRYGSNIYIDLTVCMDPYLTVTKSHQVTEELEQELKEVFAISFIDVHVEPYFEINPSFTVTKEESQPSL